MSGNGDPHVRIISELGFWAIIFLLLSLLAARQVLSAAQESETIDEGAHLVAGYSYWVTRDFRLLPSHPPLWELLCSLPLLALHPEFNPPPEAWRDADEYTIAKHFLYENRISADTLLIAGRAMTMLLTLALGFSTAWWTHRRFGAAAALFTLLALSFSPNIIAHGRYITTDLAVAAFFFWSSISWLGYLESGSARKLFWTGVLAGLACATKFSALILYPIFLLMALVYRWRRGKPLGVSKRVLFQSLVLTPFLIVYALFFFDTRSFQQDPRLGPRLEHTTGVAHALAQIPIPAYYYVRGLHILLRDLQGGHYGYLLGAQTGRGSWLYFPLAFAVKTRVATLLLLALCAVLAVRKLRRTDPFPLLWLGLALPPGVYFLVCMASTFNIGIRHLLPVYPFLYVLIGAVLFSANHGRYTPWVHAAGVVLGTLLMIESLSIHPHYLAFFNFASGGPANGPHYLLDSNLDWGQDLKKLKLWDDRHGSPTLCLDYFGQADPKYYGIPYQPLFSASNPQELARLDCMAAVSSHYLFGTESQRFRALRALNPLARIGYSIYVYDLRKPRIERLPAF